MIKGPGLGRDAALRVNLRAEVMIKDPGPGRCNITSLQLPIRTSKEADFGQGREQLAT